MSDQLTKGQRFIAEMKEFGAFPKKTQRYIRQSLDVALGRGDPVAKWARNDRERYNITTQQHNYRLVYDRITVRLQRAGKGVKMEHIEHMVGPLIAIASFDLQGGAIGGFGPFRFLYERLFGADIRPWLPSIYVAASAMPVISPDNRKVLLQSISEAACCAIEWNDSDPEFYPEWVEKVEPQPPALPAPS